MMKWLRQIISNWKEKNRLRYEQNIREYEKMTEFYRKRGLCFVCSGKGMIDLPPWGVVECSICKGSGQAHD